MDSLTWGSTIEEYKWLIWSGTVEYDPKRFEKELKLSKVTH